MNIEPMDTSTLEEQWAAWEARCSVSHAEHFASLRNSRVAFHRLSKPLSALRVALGTSGGVYEHGTQPFDMASHAGDDTVRWIAGTTPAADLRFAHDHYDHSDADRDPNCMFPLDRLREMADERVIGSVAARHVGFMGWIPNPHRFAGETVPAIVSGLVGDRVDAVVLSPG